MNFTLLVVVLALTQVYLVAAAGGSSSRNPECTVEEKDATNLVCMNGTTEYGYLTYYSEKKSKTIEIILLDVGEHYRQNGVATALLNYFMVNIATKPRFKEIKLSVVDGKQNAAAKKLYENAGFEWVPRSSYDMIKRL